MSGGRGLDRTHRRGDIYRRLGVEPIVNGRSTFTILGGSLMAAPVLDAMREAAEAFVDLVELQTAVGRRIAELTHNEAAFVTGGAAAGLFLSAATAMARDTPDGVLALDALGGLRRNFLIHRAHRIPYDQAIALAGGVLVEIGDASGTSVDDLTAALGPTTAAIVYVPKAYLADAVLPLDVVVAKAHAANVPVIVDAAAQLPPPENLWRYADIGADVVLFSGGKGLCGPASSGLALGRAAFVERLAANAAPLQRLGRPMKVGKEDMIGLLAAVEWYLAQDHAALARQYEAIVARIVEWGTGRDDVEVRHVDFGEAGQPTPRAQIRLRNGDHASRDRLLAELRRTPPRVDLLGDPDDACAVFVAPETLVPGEEDVVIGRLEATLRTLADGVLPEG